MGRRPRTRVSSQPAIRRRALPWIVSLALHVGLVVVGLMVTWSVIESSQREPPRPIVADFNAAAFVDRETLLLRETEESPPALPELEPPPPLEPLPPSLIPGLAPGLLPLSAPATNAVAEFGGARVTNARSVVYVLDASGSMTSSLSLVLKALEQSMGRLDPDQQYAVIFFRGGKAIPVPPDRLQAATPAAMEATQAWIRRGANLIPGGHSDPTAALRLALGLEPDAIFLLTEGLEGRGGAPIDRERLMAELDRLNPIANAVTGNRWTRLQGIRIGGEGELIDKPSLLRLIAERHGGPDAFVELTRDDLFHPPEDAP